MKRFLLSLAFCLLGLIVPLAASADQPTDMLQGAIADWQKGQAKQALLQADQATQNIWQKTPLYVRKAVLTGVKASSYGMYQARPDNVYPAKKALILAYLEPIGYRIFKKPNGVYEFGFRADLAFLDKDNNILVGKENFMKVDFKSHAFNREIFLNITVNIGGLPPGEYVMALRIHDTAGQSAVVRIPVAFK